MTRRERLERKLEKRREWAAGRRAKATASFDAAREAVAGIPFGQPILVGHHSEKRHRAALARQESRAMAGVESSRMAEHHEQKADGLESQLESSIFSDDPDAIEALQKRIAELEAKQERMKAVNKIIRKFTGDKAGGMAALVDQLGLTPEQAAEEYKPDVYGRLGYPAYGLQNNNANIRRLKGRIEEIKRRQDWQQAAEEAGGRIVQIRGDRAIVKFAEKPERAVLESLKAAGFRWGSGMWQGKADQLPQFLKGGE